MVAGGFKEWAAPKNLFAIAGVASRFPRLLVIWIEQTAVHHLLSKLQWNLTNCDAEKKNLHPQGKTCFLAMHFFKFHYRLESSLQVFADKFASSKQTMGGCSKLLAITWRFSLQCCLPLCSQLYSSNCQRPFSSGSRNIHFPQVTMVARWLSTGLWARVTEAFTNILPNAGWLAT